MYFYIKALHIIFIVTWFSGIFYIVRLFIYTAEANSKSEPERSILLKQYHIMQKRLWYIITWPSAILTLIFGLWVWSFSFILPNWLIVKLFFVAGLYFYHISLHIIFLQQKKGNFRWSSQQLRIWNEVATIFLVSIVMLVVVKQSLSLVWSVGVMIVFSILLFSAVKIYKFYRKD